MEISDKIKKIKRLPEILSAIVKHFPLDSFRFEVFDDELWLLIITKSGVEDAHRKIRIIDKIIIDDEIDDEININLEFI